MTEFTAPDCLVFKFEEFDCVTKKLDTTVYVFYDQREHKYVVRGQRRWNLKVQSCRYSYDCHCPEDLADFLQYLVCSNNRVNEILYNYTNFPFSSNDISFDFLNENDHSDYEISGYNDKKFSRNRLLRNLRMLKKVSNEY